MNFGELLVHYLLGGPKDCLWTLCMMFRQFFMMDVDIDSQLSAVRSENPTSFYSLSHAILNEDIILFL